MPIKVIPIKTLTAGSIPAPADLAEGEIAINIADRLIFTKDAAGNVIELIPQKGDKITVSGNAIDMAKGDNYHIVATAGEITATSAQVGKHGNIRIDNYENVTKWGSPFIPLKILDNGTLKGTQRLNYFTELDGKIVLCHNCVQDIIVLKPSEVTIIPVAGVPVTFTTGTLGTYTGKVDWGDGTIDTITANSTMTHTYADTTERVVLIHANVGHIRFGADGTFNKPNTKYKMYGLGTTSAEDMFFSVMSTGIDVTELDTSATTNFAFMFQSSAFNGDVSTLDTSKATNMKYMFNNDRVFNQSVSNFNTSKVTDMRLMFKYAMVFNQSVSNFNTSKVTDMGSMFDTAKAFNQSVSNFNTSAVTTMVDMFKFAAVFNQSVSNFNTSKVTDISGMFGYAKAFNQSVSSFNTSAVTTMANMFNGATAFNQDVSNFNTSKVTDMGSMFAWCGLNEPQIQDWNIGALTSASYMFGGMTTISTALYDEILVKWEAQPHQNNVPIHFGNAKYTAGSAADTARQALVNDGWIIQDGGTA